MNYKNEFITWYHNEFSIDQLFFDMQKMVESSPWHREQNVAVHTNMVVSQFISRSDENDGWDDHDNCHLLGAFAAAFHDTGKVFSVQYKNSEARGNYKAFGGHEKTSARLWEDWAIRNWKMLETRFNFSTKNMFTVGWMIENHLPWELKHKDKRHDLALTVLNLGIINTFVNLLMSDTTGRISDDAETKFEESRQWCSNFMELVHDVYMEKTKEIFNNAPIMVMPIAPSGAGKSTMFNKYYHSTFTHFSWDECRIQFASENSILKNETIIEQYNKAWQYCADNETKFRNWWQKKFIKLIQSKVNIYIDNTNLNRKNRRFFTTQARQHGYRLDAIMIPINLETLFTRQIERTDKKISKSMVINQYNAIQLPWFGEFDNIIINNFPTS